MSRLESMVNRKIGQWERERMSHFCQVMQRGGRTMKITFPTGIVKMIAIPADVPDPTSYSQIGAGTRIPELYLASYDLINKANWTFSS